MKTSRPFRNPFSKNAKWPQKESLNPAANDDLLEKSEFFHIDQMEAHGKDLAKIHQIKSGAGPDYLVERLSENERIIGRTCEGLMTTLQDNRHITPAAEWFLDNFYIIEEQIRISRLNLPKGYDNGLPKLFRGPSRDLPRIYDIALELIVHSDARLDQNLVLRFLKAYQSVTPLQINELWLFPIMLRLALIENLNRLAKKIDAGRLQRQKANFWADKLIEMAEKDSTNLILVIADMAWSKPQLESAFVAEIARRLRGPDPALALPLNWIEQRLSLMGTSIEQFVNTEVERQSRDQLSLSNSIGSLRFLITTNWRPLVEDLSHIEHILKQDPAGIYSLMDFQTRDFYRHSIEKTAKKASLPEVEIAQRALDYAQEKAAAGEEDTRSHHVGFYLIGAGKAAFERAIGISPSLAGKGLQLMRHPPVPLYLAASALLSIIIGIKIALSAFHGFSSVGLFAFAAFLSVLAATQLSVTIINWLLTIITEPDFLPRLDFSKGIPNEFRTFVVVPTFLTTTAGIDSLCEALEVRFLANSMRNVHFGLLTDFTDAPNETIPEDEALLTHARENINALNKKYASEEDIFFLLHRPRRWNPQEKVWMGYERKRGKLAALNTLLRTGDTKSFSSICGHVEALRGTKYVLTLDVDTKLPRDAAYQLIGAMAHPLNHPHYDEKEQRVTQGYGILQPRISNSLLAPNVSTYATLYSIESGIDPYTRVVSDVYQDAFGEGSFVGKGIYDVETFDKALGNKLPENLILSHDLLEGCYLRSGLISDIQLYESYPSRYETDVSRRHRWIRGDWQIVSWLFPSVPGRDQQSVKNHLSTLSRWKIFDNLRRSLMPLIFTALLVLGWTLFPSHFLWTLSVIGILLIPFIASALFALLHKPAAHLIQHLMNWAAEEAPHLALVCFNFIVLPYEAFYHADAIARACWRMWISHTGLLEWKTSCEDDQKENRGITGAFQSMWFAPALALCLFVLLSLYRPVALKSADIILALWVLAPAIAWKLSQSVPSRQETISDKDITYLRMLARKIWNFFDFYVGPEDNWLPPDNVQELPVALVAHRTSPTNIGLALLANLTAWDFGYISTGTLIERTENTLHTMEKLERYDGHFLNWYHTVTLAPLHPAYVSTVDSGNLAGHLLTLQQGLLSVASQKVFDLRILDGCKDTLNLLILALNEKIPAALKDFEGTLKSGYEMPISPEAVEILFKKMAQEAIAFRDNLPAGTETDVIWWSSALARQCEDIDTGYQALFSGIRKEFTDMPDLNELSARGSALANEQIKALNKLAQTCHEMSRMAYGFLYDSDSRLLAIGYNVTDSRRDTSYYDLLASEARLAAFVAIAQGQIPQESWFALGRKLSRISDKSLLMSWSGSMFEYLMPLLVMPSYKNTLLDSTCKAAVALQIEYGLQKNDVWGISESGYYGFDVHLNYQYRAFGVPGLGFKRGLADDFVIAPYASIMALTVMPEKVPRNLLQLSKAGFESRFGFYEAIDYTVSRIPRGKPHAIVKSFMSHHQGMSLLSLASFLLQQPMQKRFEKAPLFQTTMPLLHEKSPRAAGEQPAEAKVSITHAATKAEPQLRVFSSPNTLLPEVQLLSNGRYHCMISNAGGGYSRWKDLAVTRWRADVTRDNWGSFCYIRDLKKRVFWSTGFQPTLKQPELYEAILPEGRAEFRRRDGDIETHTEIIVSPEDDVEVRRVSISNRSHRRRSLEVTSYGEIVLATPAADMAHPAFSNLFVQTELLPRQQAILCTRRLRSAEDHPPWMCHLMTVHGAKAEEASFETDRMAFIGRGNSTAAPQAMQYAGPLSGSAGCVLDPIISIRRRILVEPGKTAVINIVTGVAENRENCLALVDKYQDSHLVDRIFDLASSHNEVIVHQLNATEADTQMYSSLASLILYPNAALRGETSALIKNHRGQSGLWSYGVSGDLPIVLLRIGNGDNMNLVRQMIQAHAYWRLKGLSVDLLICHGGEGGYRQSLQDQIVGLISVSLEAHLIDRPGGIFVRHIDQIPPEDRLLLESVACIVLHNEEGTLEDYMRRIIRKPPRIPRLASAPEMRASNDVLPKHDLALFNGFGGFSADGKEYVITVPPGQKTPAPWSNILANPSFGSVISESGAAYTWNENAHEFRLTPWQNDPVSDVSGEAFYLRDEQTGQVWSPAPDPAPATAAYMSRHGFGYSVFECVKGGIHTELWVYAALDMPVKFSVLKVKNESGRTRKLSATGYVEWVLGDLRSKTGMHIVTEVDKTTGTVFARNGYNTDFPGQVAFFDVNDPHRYVTCDRTEFIGRNRSLNNPSALKHVYLSGRSGAGLDPCAALQTFFNIADGEERTIIFKLGIAGREGEDICAFVRRLQSRSAAETALNAVRRYWDETLGAVQVKTPDASINMLANGWLIYQTIACRLWARSGYYQSGGAFGFRDQLQDAMAVVHTQPAMLRDQILLCAAHQFKEGDVQHWWHPPSGRGVRTKCSDDYLWLPLALCRYIETTGDTAILDQKIPFIEGRTLRPEEESYYDMPVHSADVATLYEHGLRAIHNGLRFGIHGLPLIGSCDWNDGMDKIGAHGRGESVWLAFFLYDILNRFQKIAVLHGDHETAELCQAEAVILRHNIEKNGWDGEWYRRAYFDDGTPLGSAMNTECQIDSLSQSWAILSGGAAPEHAQNSMEALYRRLVRQKDALVLLFDPPFDKADPNPGYIRGYAPGVRENGGQYTHAAIWAAMAFAKMGDSDRAYELLEIINPLNHASTAAAAARYRVEPYVVAADVYGAAPYTGRGGWTWYTGSAGWMYRLILESILGLHLQDHQLTFEPHLPSAWDSFTIDYKYKSALYKINVTMVPPEEETSLHIDGALQEEHSIQLMDDGLTHSVEIKMRR